MQSSSNAGEVIESLYMTSVSNGDQNKIEMLTNDATSGDKTQIDQLGVGNQPMTILEIAENRPQNGQLQQIYQLVPQNIENQQSVLFNQPLLSPKSSASNQSYNKLVLAPSTTLPLSDGQVSVIESNGQQYLILPNFAVGQNQQILIQEPSQEHLVEAVNNQQSSGIVSSQNSTIQTSALNSSITTSSDHSSMAAETVNGKNLTQLKNVQSTGPILVPASTNGSIHHQNVNLKTADLPIHGLEITDIIPSFFQRTVPQETETGGFKTCPFCTFQAPSIEQLEEHKKTHGSSTHEAISRPVASNKTRKRAIQGMKQTKPSGPKKKKSQMIRTVPPPNTAKDADNYPLSCSVCQAKITSPNQYKKHMKKHENEKPYNCDECSESFNKERNLNLHKSLHAKLDSMKNQGKYKCPECQKTFSRMAGLKMHILMHAEEETLMCKECGDEFNSNVELKTHILEHTSDLVRHLHDKSKVSLVIQQPRPEPVKITVNLDDFPDNFNAKKMTAQQSNKNVTEKQTSQDVLDLSAGARTCNVCKKVFQRKSQLKRHLLIHTGEKPYRCPHCDKAFNQNSAMQTHMSMHTNEKPHNCPHCPQTYRQRGNLRIHIARVHDVSKADSFQCQICACSFKKLGSLNAHVTKYHSDQDLAAINNAMTAANNIQSPSEQLQEEDEIEMFLQTVLDKSNNDGIELADQQDSDIVHRALEQSNLQAENPTFDGIESTQLVIQAESFLTDSTNGSGNIATSTKASTDIVASSDNQATEANAAQSMPIAISSDPTPPLVQSIQEKSTKQDTLSSLDLSSFRPSVTLPIKNMNVLWRVCYNDGIRNHECLVCFKVFRKPSDLARHIRIHTMEKPYKCRLCSRAFTVKSSLKSHTRTHLGIKSFRCQICQKSFTTSGSLKVHTRLHTGAKPFPCPQCDKTFRTTGHRQAHLATHDKKRMRAQAAASKDQTKKIFPKSDLADVKLLGPLVVNSAGTTVYLHPRKLDTESRPFKCPGCHKSFKKSCHLTQHRRSHIGERPFTCSTCKRSFMTKAVLKAHLRTHSDTPAFICDVCEQGFSTKGSLTRHSLRHSDKRPFICPYCKKTFKSNVNCRKHIKIHRSEVAMMQQKNDGNVVGQNTSNVVTTPINVTPGSTVSGLPSVEDTLSSNFINNIQGAINPNDSVTKQISVNSNVLQNLGHDGAINITNVQSQQPTFILTPNVAQQSDGHSVGVTGQELSLEDLAGLSAENTTLLVNPDQGQTDLSIFGLDMSPSTDANRMTVTLGQPIFVDNISLLESLNTAPPLTMTNQDTSLQPRPPISVSTSTHKTNVEITTPLLPDSRGEFFGGKLITVDQAHMYQCTGCEAIFSLENFQEHQRSLNDEKLPHSCDLCYHRFKKKSHYESHVKFHRYSGPVYKCSKCGIGFIHKQILEEHTKSHQQEIHKMLLPSTKKKVGATAESVKTPHARKTTRSSFFKLTEEQNRILSQTNPNLHMTVSERILLSAVAEKDRVVEAVVEKRGRQKPLEIDGPRFSNVCPHCPKSFRKNNDLVRHIRTHTGERPFKCKECGKSFSIKSYLFSHEKTHLGLKPFRCHICDLMYATKTSLKVHMRLHTGGKPYKCPHCSEQFRTSGHRKNHIATHFVENGSKFKRKKKQRLENNAQNKTELHQQQINQNQVLLSDLTLTVPEGMLQASDNLQFQWNGQMLQLVNTGQTDNDLNAENLTLQLDNLQQTLNNQPTTSSQDVIRNYTQPVNTGPAPNLVIQPISLPDFIRDQSNSGNGQAVQEINVAVPASLAPLTQILFQSPTISSAQQNNDNVTMNNLNLAQSLQQLLNNNNSPTAKSRKQDASLAANDDLVSNQGLGAGGNLQPFTFDLLTSDDANQHFGLTLNEETSLPTSATS